MNKKIKRIIKSYALYIIRWQLSTPILTFVLMFLNDIPTIWATIIANFIGALIFFPVDKIIFKRKSKLPKWEIQQGICIDCGSRTLVYRIVEWGKYDRNDAEPQWRCRTCSLEKMESINH